MAKELRLGTLDLDILEAALSLSRRGVGEFYGYAIAKEIRDQTEAKLLTSYGSLYKSLSRLERYKLLASRWEDAAVAAEQTRPRRRLYEITALGRTELVRRSASDAPVRALVPRPS